MKLWQIFVFIPVIILTFILTSKAFSQDCYSASQNPQWIALQTEFNQAYQKKDYDTALEIAKELEGICSESPLINYLIANLYKEKHQIWQAMEHYKRATRAMTEFSVEPLTAKKIWYARFEMENKSKSSLLLPGLYKRLKEAEEKQIAFKLSHQEALQNKQNANSLLYSGLALSIGGALLSGIGGSLLGFGFKEKALFPYTPFYPDEKHKTFIHAGSSVLVVGVCTLISGVILSSLSKGSH